jgi:hypothetical protein
VRIVAATSFGGGVGSLEALRAGDFVEISGYSDGAGGVIASRIERRAAGEVEVRGVVNNLDTAAKTFDIASLHVDYSAAGVLTNLPGGVPSNGDFVAAAGTFDGMALHASRIAREDATLDGKSGDHAEVEGAITLVISPSALQVGVQRVVTTSSTMFEQGSAADLAVGSIVEAEGTLDGTGQLVAARIQFRQEGELQLTGTVMSIAAAQHTFDLLGRTIEVNSLTRFEDDSSGSMPLSFASLNISDFLEVRAYESGTRTVATRIKREPAQSEVDLRGTPSAFALPLFELLGQIIITDAATEFRDGSQPIDQVTFFALAPLGSRLVRVKGTSESTTTIRAAEVRLED